LVRHWAETEFHEMDTLSLLPKMAPPAYALFSQIMI
jgi:hypothetical protein